MLIKISLGTKTLTTNGAFEFYIMNVLFVFSQETFKCKSRVTKMAFEGWFVTFISVMTIVQFQSVVDEILLISTPK